MKLPSKEREIVPLFRIKSKKWKIKLVYHFTEITSGEALKLATRTEGFQIKQ